MPSHPTLTDLLQRARKRLFSQLVLDKGALALVIGMAGAILLLLTGTQILDWYWPVLLIVASLGVGIYRLRKSLPSFYELAQAIDRRLGLADSLSTAVHFAAHPEPGREAVSECQRRDAELVAQRVDVRQAVPPWRSRYLLPAAGLALVAFGLFAVRYAVTGTLSLEPSLLRIAYDSFFGTPPQQLAKNQAKRPNLTQQPFDPGSPEAASTTTDPQPEDLFDAKNPSDAANPQGDDNGKQATGKEGDQKDGDADKKGDNGDSKDGKQGDKGSQDSKDGSKDGKEGDQGAKNDKDDKQNSDSGQSSLMDKIKDAVANMLNKMKPNPSQKQQNAKNQPPNKGDQNDQNTKGEKSENADKQNKTDEVRADNAPGGEQSDAEGAKPNNKPGQQSSPDSPTGAGSKDGEKAIRDAKALQAMGQISEILGKRSATVTGEMMIEVGSTKQQIKTPWADRQAGHTESGGEIHRDEVPLIYQPFVERYFEEIRKSPPAKSK